MLWVRCCLMLKKWAMETDKLLLLGGLGVAAYLLLNNQPAATSPVSQTASPSGSLPSVSPSANVAAQSFSYPYLVPGAPAMPSTYNDAYYKTYIRPAMVAANPNINNPGYTLSPTDVTNYLNNYLDLRQWDYSYGPAFQSPPYKGQSIQAAAQGHWHNYGVPEQRTFLPLPWSDMSPYGGPQPNSKSAGGGVLRGILQIATIVGGGAAEVLSAGTLTPIVAPATSAALTAESMIHGAPDTIVLNDAEIALVVSSAAIIKKILPFYLEVAPELVASIENRLDAIISTYQS